MDLRQLRRGLLAAAAIQAAIAAAIAVVILPAVVIDTYPAATPDRAGPILRAVAAANLVLALWYIILRAEYMRISAIARFAWVLGPIFSLLLGAPLLDAALAYWSHGQEMHGVSLALFGCVIGSALSAIQAYTGHRH